ncbi:MAG: hypothetical protein J6Y78_01890 [Paludibacteraceae bacterium]|nr:hypothetical protein [Paludibacteraceae bacterium]
MEKEKLLEQLPENIANSVELSDDSKRVLGALLYWLLNSKAYETGVLFISNAKLRSIAGMKQNYMLDAISELKEFGLIDRKVGGERGCASEYTIYWDNLKKPLKKKSFEDKFSKFFDKGKSLETPLGTTLHNISLHNNTYHNNSLHNNTYQDSSFENIIEEKTDNNIKIDSIEIMKKEEEIEKPRNLKELGDFFKNKVISKAKECERIEDFFNLETEMEEELDKYQFIEGYKNCLYSIKDYISRKIEDFQIKELVV